VFSSAATDILTNARGGKRATLRVAAADAQLRSAETARAKNRLRARLENAKERRTKAVARMKAAC
jgi:ascorbate-specific PTS system EIIC-type component UlaA